MIQFTSLKDGGRLAGGLLGLMVVLTGPVAQAQPGNKVPVTVGMPGGRPTMMWGRQAVEMPAFWEAILWNETEWKRRMEPFIQNGVKVFHIGTGNWGGVFGQSEFWMGEDDYPNVDPQMPGFTFESRVQYILSRVPDAKFVVRMTTIAPKQWVDRNPGEMQLGSNGKTYQPSWASEKYLSGVSRHYARLVKYCEARPWGNRVLGYLIVPIGEGLQEQSTDGNFYDRSPAMQAAWKDYLGKKYPSDEALKKAWGDPSVSLASVTVPTDADLRAKITQLPHWPAPGSLAKEHDYVALQRELFARWFTTLTRAISDNAGRKVLVGIDSFKEPLLGWQIQEEFGGQGLGTASFPPILASGSLGVGTLLDSPWLSCLMNPADYHARNLGYGFEPEGLCDSMRLRSKLYFVENDARTQLSQESAYRTPPQGSFMNQREQRAGLLRNSAASLARGMVPYWTDIGFRASFYTDPKVQSELKRDQTIQQRGTHWPLQETEHAIAVIIDDESPLFENFTTGFQNLALLRQRTEGLETCGLPYRQYLLSDLEKENFPKYRCYLFPNLFKVDDRVLGLLKRKVFRDGAIAIFGPGTGITDGTTVSVEGAEKVLGIPMHLYGENCSRHVRLGDRSLLPLRAKGMPGSYGDSYSYGPTLLPDPKRLDGSVQVLGTAAFSWEINAPGLVLKDFGRGGSGGGKAGARGAGDYAVAFTGALPMPPALLRSLARYGGCNVWCDDDVAVFANHGMVAVHGVNSGAVTLQLPWRPDSVVDAVSGDTVAGKVNRFQVKLGSPDTRVFLLR